MSRPKLSSHIIVHKRRILCLVFVVAAPLDISWQMPPCRVYHQNHKHNRHSYIGNCLVSQQYCWSGFRVCRRVTTFKFPSMLLQQRQHLRGSENNIFPQPDQNQRPKSGAFQEQHGQDSRGKKNRSAKCPERPCDTSWRALLDWHLREGRVWCQSSASKVESRISLLKKSLSDYLLFHHFSKYNK